MAKKTTAAWGIDIGLYALKALRCRVADDGSDKIVAEAFDFIEYPRPLSESTADPVTSIRDALKMFLSRNKVRGDKVIISVPGQSGLARFIKLPPVESKKIPDIVRYEARQQIPFPLDEVVWDYQQMGAGGVEDGFALDCEVGIFALKREQVNRALLPFVEANVEVDIVQLTPIALYNMLVFDQLRDIPPPDQYDPENPPESTVLLSIGTETTDFVVTNGYKMWQRNLPVGGNHFTKALVKEMKMNYETAEHLKRNASKAPDPKALFQAMRPVFSDLLNEVEKSLKFYSNFDKTAKIGRIVAAGNAVKLPGLQRFLTQNLGFDVAKLEAYRGLSGTGVVDAPPFKENMLSYGVCYGLALQGLKRSRLATNLLPRDILQYRMIRAKKPWALTAAALLLVGFTVNYGKHFAAMKSAMLEGPEGFAKPVAAATALKTEVDGYAAQFEEARGAFRKTYQIGDSFLQNVQGRRLWLESMWVINSCLPQNTPDAPAKADDLSSRRDVKITTIECRREENLAEWYSRVQKRYEEGLVAVGLKPAAAAPAAPADPAAPVDPAAPPAEVAADPGPTGSGWVFELQAHHYFNHRSNPADQGISYLRRTLLADLLNKELSLPAAEAKRWGLIAFDDPRQEPVRFKPADVGLKYPVLLDTGPIDWNYEMEVADPAQTGPTARKKVKAPRYSILVQFVWKEVLPAARAEKIKAQQVAAAAGK
jgi:type IV pilus assembly protein PilM